jgi:hypothetical protein
MKQVWFIGLVAIMLFNAGCPGEKSRPQGTTNRQGRGAAGPNANGQITGQNGGAVIPQRPTGGTSIWGLIVPEAGFVTSSHNLVNGNWAANDVARWFLSSDFHPEDVGATTKEQDSTWNQSCGTSQYCGIEFTASQMTINPPNLNQARQGGTVPVQGGILGMAFWDSYVGKVDSDGIPYSPIPVYVNIVSGQSYIQGNRIVLTFQDTKGTIQFDGNLSGNQYAGTVTFQNTVNYSGQNDWGTSARLGRFQINACAIFPCQ